MIGLSGEIPLVSHSDVTSPFPPSGNGGYASNQDVLYEDDGVGLNRGPPDPFVEQLERGGYAWMSGAGDRVDQTKDLLS